MILTISHRAYALHRNRPLSLQSTINLPTLTDDPTDPYAHHLNGFILVVNLFRPFDDAFVATWNKTRNNWPAPHIHNLQKQLADILPNFLNYGDSQLADLWANQQWIKTMTGHLSMGNGSMSAGGDESMVYQQYAANLATSLLSGSMSLSNSEVAATSMVRPSFSSSVAFSPQLTVMQLTKLFDIACTLTEVLAIHPASRDPFSPGPREQLNPLLNILSMLRNGDSRFMPLLLSKVQEVLPKLVNPMLQNVPDSVANNMCNVDIFDGFGNAGMAQPSAMMDTYEKSMPSNEVSSQGGGSSSGNDMHSPPFVSSPASPGGDFSGIPNGNFNPMTEVMNQMGPTTSIGHNGQGLLSGASPTPHLKQEPLTPITPMSNLNSINTSLHQPPNMAMNQNLGRQSFDQGMSFGMNGVGQNLGNMHNMMPRQPPARTNSFAIPPNPQMRAMGDFQSVQRTNSDITTLSSLGMGNNSWA